MITAYNCPETFDQLEEDFKRFESGIDLRELWHAGNAKRWGTEATIHYVIYNQKVYTKRLGKITDFKMFVDGMVHSLLRKSGNSKLPPFQPVYPGYESMNYSFHSLKRLNYLTWNLYSMLEIGQSKRILPIRCLYFRGVVLEIQQI